MLADAKKQAGLIKGSGVISPWKLGRAFRAKITCWLLICQTSQMSQSAWLASVTPLFHPTRPQFVLFLIKSTQKLATNHQVVRCTDRGMDYACPAHRHIFLEASVTQE